MSLLTKVSYFFLFVNYLPSLTFIFFTFMRVADFCKELFDSQQIKYFFQYVIDIKKLICMSYQ
jgi:hypothetical protein